MSVVIGSSIGALHVGRRLTEHTAGVSETLNRISSGLRINRASDDAAGLAIASSLAVDSRVFYQGLRNFNDGASLLSVGESATNELSNILIRIRELATQSSNGTLSSTQRHALNLEAQALQQEYNRILDTAEFNGLTIFGSDTGSIRFQGGYGENGALYVNLVSAEETVGTGTFQAGVSYPVGSTISGAANAADLNGDGFADLVTTDASANRVRVHINNGNGTFKAPITYAGPSNGFDIVLEDFNNDNKIDIALAGSTFSGLYVLFGNGNGTLKAQTSYSGSQTPNGVLARDLDNDGDLDLVINTKSDNYITAFFNNGSGSFSSKRSFFIDDTSSGPGNQLDIMDVNGDDILDMVIASGGTSPGSLNVRLGIGGGSFAGLVSYDFNPGEGPLGLADFNEDGKIDVIFQSNAADGRLRLSLGNGDGTFKAPNTFQVTPNSMSHMTVADLNDDGHKDFILPSVSPSGYYVHLGNGDGTFKASASYLQGTDGSGNLESRRPNLVDVDGDGIADLVGINPGTGAAFIFTADTVTTEASLRRISGIDLSTRTTSLAAQDSVDSYLSDVHAITRVIGAAMSRIDHAVRNLAVGSESTLAANSRIMDADMAEETAQLVRSQILQRASVVVLAQVNLEPQIALGLLQRR